MASSAESRQFSTARKIEHHIFHTDEELEHEACLAELNGGARRMPVWMIGDLAADDGRNSMAMMLVGLSAI